ncbi:MAG: helix-turn-helix domain-containing protein [Leucobacter sp.]
MPRRVSDFRGLTHTSRLRLLHAVQRVPGRRLPELADEVGLHLNTAREHLELMEQEGLVQSFRLTTGTRGRPPKVFYPVGDVENTPTAENNPAAERRVAGARERGDLLRRVSPELDRTSELGEAAAHQIDTLYEHLEDAGFEPVLDESQLTIGLTPCRYFSAMESHRRIVCSVHVRLIHHHLSQIPGPAELRRVEPFAGPEHCLISLGIKGEETATPPHDRAATEAPGSTSEPQ